MWSAIFDPLALGVCGGLGFIAVIVALLHDGFSKDWARGCLDGWHLLEAGLTAFLGAFLARSFIAAILYSAADAEGVVGNGPILVVSWFFFLWPGAVNTISVLVSGKAVAGVEVLLWMALAVGGITGLFDGLWRIHKWRGPGVLTFLADVTWGLLGSTNGALLHVVNFTFGHHADAESERRRGAHRYKGGFRIMADYAFTQGNVMSNLKVAATKSGKSLYKHERFHVSQNRIFGPLYVLAYLGWMLALIFPSLARSIFHPSKAGDTFMWWTYYNNPYEVWAYQYGGGRGGPTTSPSLKWPTWAVILGAALHYSLMIGLMIFCVLWAWALL